MRGRVVSRPQEIIVVVILPVDVDTRVARADRDTHIVGSVNDYCATVPDCEQLDMFMVSPSPVSVQRVERVCCESPAEEPLRVVIPNECRVETQHIGF